MYRINRSEEPEDADSLLSEPKGDPVPPQTPQSPKFLSGQKGKLSVDLLREVEKFSKQKIEQLIAVKEADTLLVLSNGQVHLHDLGNWEFKETLSRSKGASVLAKLGPHKKINTNVATEEVRQNDAKTSRLAVAVKRRLLVWDWTGTRTEVDPKEVVLISAIKSLTWINREKIIVGLGSNYVLVNVDSGDTTDIVGPGSIGGAPGQDGGRFGGAGVAGMGYLGMTAPTPLATRLGENEALLAKDINTHFIDADGNALGRRQVPWASAPDAVGFSCPYLLAVQSAKSTMEVRNPQTVSLLQTVSVAANRICFPEEGVKWAFSAQDFLALSERAVWRMKPLDYGSQLDDLVKLGHLDEAISLLAGFDSRRLTNKDARMKEIKMIKAQSLFDHHKFRDAIDLFTEIAAPPEGVIALFPPFISGDLSAPSPKSTKTTTDHESDSQESSPRHHRKENSTTSQNEQGKSMMSLLKGQISNNEDPSKHSEGNKPLGKLPIVLITEI